MATFGQQFGLVIEALRACEWIGHDAINKFAEVKWAFGAGSGVVDGFVRSRLVM